MIACLLSAFGAGASRRCQTRPGGSEERVTAVAVGRSQVNPYQRLFNKNIEYKRK